MRGALFAPPAQERAVWQKRLFAKLKVVVLKRTHDLIYALRDCFLWGLILDMGHWQHRHLCFLQPNHRNDHQCLLLLNQTRQVVVQDFAQHFVHHPRLAAAHHRLAMLPLDRAEDAFDIAPQVVVVHVFVLIELEEAKRLLKQAADTARRIRLEVDKRLRSRNLWITF
jgi:hypothetical protein